MSNKKKSKLEKMDTFQVFPNARKYKTILTTKFVNRKKWQRPDLQEIKSIIPGVVASIEVKKGDHVKKGAHLITFEAMKMMNLVLAPFDGTVENIFVKKGEKIAKGVTMIYLKSDVDLTEEIDPTTSNDLGLIL